MRVRVQYFKRRHYRNMKTLRSLNFVFDNKRFMLAYCIYETVFPKQQGLYCVKEQYPLYNILLQIKIIYN